MEFNFLSAIIGIGLIIAILYSVNNNFRWELEKLNNKFFDLVRRVENLEKQIDKASLEKGKEPALTAAPLPPVPEIKEEKPAPTPLPALSAEVSPAPVFEQVKQDSYVLPQEEPLVEPREKTNIEFNLGRLWLNKIGIALFTLGVAFLIVYTFKYFGPLLKILTGYLICAALFFLGDKLEKNKKFINYGRVIIAGSWAIAYFTTYAMYYFPASRIINNQLLDLLLLGFLSVIIIINSLKYNSQELSALAIFMAYITVTMGDISYFTFVGCLFLSVITVVIVYKKQWIKIIFLGLPLTYLAHYVWVAKQIHISGLPVTTLTSNQMLFLLNAGFFASYWLVFAISTHLMRNGENKHDKALSIANLLNFALFFAAVYRDLLRYYPEHKIIFTVVLAFIYVILAIFSEFGKKDKLCTSNIVIAVLLITFSVYLKFLHYHAIIIWFIEVPFLIYSGIFLEKKVLRYLGFGLVVFLFFNLLAGNPRHFNYDIADYTYLIGFLSMAASFYLVNSFKNKAGLDEKENLFHPVISLFGVIYLIKFLWQIAKPYEFFGFYLAVTALMLVVIGLMMKDKYIRMYSVIPLVMVLLRFCFVDSYYGQMNAALKWFMILFEIACCYLAYFLYGKTFDAGAKDELEKKYYDNFIFLAPNILLIFMGLKYISPDWTTFSLTIITLFLISLGYALKDKKFIYLSLLPLFISGLHFCENAMNNGRNNLSMGLKTVTILLELAACYSIYFLYRKSKEIEITGQNNTTLKYTALIIANVLLVFAVYKYIPDNWISLLLGLSAVILFFMGFMLSNKDFRFSCFVLFGITLLRLVIIDLKELNLVYKIISFIILGIIFLAVSFIYTKYNIGRTENKT